MSTFTTADVSETAAEDLSAALHLLLKLGSGGASRVSAATDDVWGVCVNPAVSGQQVGVQRYGIAKVKAAGAIAKGAKVYPTADGEVTDTAVAGSFCIGTAVEAASGDGSVIGVELKAARQLGDTYVKQVRCIFATADNVTIGRFVPGHAGSIVKAEMHVDVVTSETTGKTNVATPAIGTVGGSLTPTTGGSIIVDVDTPAADPDAIGKRIAGTAITALNTFTAAQEIGIVMDNTTPLTSGEGTITLTIQKS